MEFLLEDNGDGGELQLSNGDIKQDDTFASAVYLSLFNGDCFYNIYSKYKSDMSFEEALNLPLTALNLQTVKAAGQNLLSWMTEENIASSVEVSAYGDKNEKINVNITVTEPDGTPRKYAITWANEKRIFGIG